MRIYIMALNALQSFQLNGILDNCQDFIDQIVPVDTPFYNALAKVPHRSGAFKWLTDWNDGDVLGTTLGTNAPGGRIENIDDTDVPVNSSENLSISKQEEVLNYTQIFRKFVKVSKTAVSAQAHGRTNEAVYQIAKATDALKNQIEATFISGQTKAIATSTVGAKTDGATAQIPQTMFSADDTAAGVAALCNKLFQNGSNADTIYCNRRAIGALKHLMDVGAGVGPYLQWQEEGKDYMTFTDINGRLYKLIAHRHLDQVSGTALVAIFLNHDDFQCVVKEDWKVQKLDTRGSYDEYIVSCEVGLRHSGKYKAAVLAKA